jgi:hypothetical protein
MIHGQSIGFKVPKHENRSLASVSSDLKLEGEGLTSGCIATLDLSMGRRCTRQSREVELERNRCAGPYSPFLLTGKTRAVRKGLTAMMDNG